MYSLLKILKGICFDLYKILSLPHNIDSFYKTTMTKYRHPSISYGCLGIDGKSGGSFILQEYKQSLNLGIHLFPLGGLGVFKSKYMLFYIRTQKKGISCYESTSTDNTYAQG